MCYTLPMSENQQNWIPWARTLQRWGVRETVAYLLETAGSLNILAAQLLYISQPLLSGVVSPHSIGAFARLLENPAERGEFVSYLREAPSSDASA